jgi:hypothetical protein
MNIPQYHFEHDMEIINLGDLHRGNQAHNRSLFYKVVDYIASNSHVYWLSTGDLFEMALKEAKGDVYNSMGPGQEWKSLELELRTIADKCLGLVASNHSVRFERAVGMSIDELFANNMNLPYLGDIAVINVTVGRASYFIGMHHGTGFGKRRGSKTNNTQDLAAIIPGCDIYMEGHTHSFDHFIDECFYLDKKRGSLVKYDAQFVVTGHFIEWEKSYAPRLKLRPMPQGSARVSLGYAGSGNQDRKSVGVDLCK